MNFDEQKTKYLEALYKPDKSKKGSVDEKVIPIIDMLNDMKDYVSTSSCSGRIDLLSRSKGGKKHESEWPYVTHGLADSNKIWNTLQEEAKKEDREVWMKMEAPIMHIMCRDIESAQSLINFATKVGFKYSGIFVTKPGRVLVQIMGCEKIEGLVATDGELLVDQNYIEKITIEANKKLTSAHTRLENLFKEIKELWFFFRRKILFQGEVKPRMFEIIRNCKISLNEKHRGVIDLKH